MIQIGAKGTLKRLDEMLESAMNGTFDETSYDETELSRLESRWKQYFTAQGQLVGQVKKERENIRTLVSDISHQTKTPLANILLYAELLDEKAENEEEKMLAGQIVRQTEKLIDEVLEKSEEEKRRANKVRYINYKIYVNSIRKAFGEISMAEKNAKYFQEENEGFVEIKIVIPKNNVSQRKCFT